MKKRLTLIIIFGWVLSGLWAVGCDTWVALFNVTKDGVVLFAKNSDRLLFSSQPLEFHARKEWPESVRIDLGRLSIPQAGITYATLGSSPYWCWGYEQGINEFGVAIGNEGVDTKALAESLSRSRAGKGPELGPTGMDLLRLGLERGKTARAALDVITKLVEEYGQFGSGMPTLGIEGAYDNSFLISDPREAWILETAGRHWAAKRISRGTASISTTLSIDSEYDLCSDDLEEFAVKSGWWPAQESPFHFATAYGNDSPAGQAKSIRARIRAACSLDLLGKETGNITPRWMMRIARDRSTHPSLDLDVTASSTVAWIPDPEKSLPVFWWCASVPSSSCYTPFFVHGLDLPDIVTRAGTAGNAVSAPSRTQKDSFSEQSYWWIFRDLADKVNGDRPRRLPVVRSAFDRLEEEFESGLTKILDQALSLRQKGLNKEAAEILDGYSLDCASRAMAKANELRRLFSDTPVQIPERLLPYIGTYVANFASFRDAAFPVDWYEGKLSVTIPGQGRISLKDPDEKGRWFFENGSNVFVSFELKESGSAETLLFHQTTLLPRSADPGDSGDIPDKLKPLLGFYTVPGTGQGYNITVKSDGLALVAPNKMVIPLEGPDAEGDWSIPVQPGTKVVFIKENGAVSALAFKQVFRLPRKSPPQLQPEETQSVQVQVLCKDQDKIISGCFDPGKTVVAVRDIRQKVWTDYSLLLSEMISTPRGYCMSSRTNAPLLPCAPVRLPGSQASLPIKISDGGLPDIEGRYLSFIITQKNDSFRNLICKIDRITRGSTFSEVLRKRNNKI